MKYPEKIRARYLATRALKKGELIKTPCEHRGCDEEKVQMHHPDYSQPLRVEFLCKKHHVKADARDHPIARVTPTTSTLSFRVEPSLYDLADRVAKAAGMPLADWLRRSLGRLVREELDGEHPAVTAFRWIAEGFDSTGCDCAGDGEDDWGARVAACATDWDDHHSYCGDYVRGYIFAKFEEFGVGSGHGAPQIDEETGDQKEDASGLLLWRTVKHDLEEFYGPVERHGLCLDDVRRFAAVAQKAQVKFPFMADPEGDAEIVERIDDAIVGGAPGTVH